MRAVIYSAIDLEPITVVDLPDWAVAMLRQHDHVYLDVLEPFTAGDLQNPIEALMRRVEIWAEPLRRGDKDSLMIFTRDEESALLMEAAFLPGQRRELRDRIDEARAQGFWNAMHKLAAERRGRG